MLEKLLKYDLKYMIKNMGVFYILAIVFSLLTRIFFAMKQTVIVGIIGQICVGFMFAMIFSTIINTVIRSWVRFRDSLYKDEAYLTHTLPVTKNQIYESRFIQTLIFTIVGFVIVVISLFIAYYTEDRWIMLRNTINGLSSSLNLETIPFIISIFVIVFFRRFAVDKNAFDFAVFNYRVKVVRHNVFYRAVRAALDVARRNHIPKRNMIFVQKRLFILNRFRNVISEYCGGHFPESVLGMSVKEQLFARFYGRKAPQNENF